MAERSKKKLRVLQRNLRTKQCSLRNSFVSSREDMKSDLQELLVEPSTISVFVVDPDQHIIAHTYNKLSNWEKLLHDLFQEILKGMLVVLLSNDDREHCFAKVENIYITSEC